MGVRLFGTVRPACFVEGGGMMLLMSSTLGSYESAPERHRTHRTAAGAWPWWRWPKTLWARWVSEATHDDDESWGGGGGAACMREPLYVCAYTAGINPSIHISNELVIIMN